MQRQCLQTHDPSASAWHHSIVFELKIRSQWKSQSLGPPMPKTPAARVVRTVMSKYAALKTPSPFSSPFTGFCCRPCSKAEMVTADLDMRRHCDCGAKYHTRFGNCLRGEMSAFNADDSVRLPHQQSMKVISYQQCTAAFTRILTQTPLEWHLLHTMGCHPCTLGCGAHTQHSALCRIGTRTRHRQSSLTRGALLHNDMLSKPSGTSTTHVLAPYLETTSRPSDRSRNASAT